MNRGALLKTFREVRLGALIFAAAVAVVEAFLAAVLPTFVDEAAGQVLKVPFVRNMLSALLGAEMGDSVGPTIIMPLVWAHPLLLGLLAAQEITFCTRVPAGEIDRGTIDVLLSLPVSRLNLYVVETFVFVATGACTMLAAFAGHRFGSLFIPPEFVLTMPQLIMIICNLFSLYLAVGALAFAVSSMSDLRGRAIAVVLGILLASFLLNFLAQFWEPAKSISWACVLNYYQPARVLITGAWPIGDVLTLLAVAVSCWLIGALVFRRRDICTV